VFVHICKLFDVYGQPLPVVCLPSSAGNAAASLNPVMPYRKVAALRGRESDYRHIALPPTLLPLMEAIEANYGWLPHLRLFSSRTLHQLEQRLGIRAPGLVREGFDECCLALVCWAWFCSPPFRLPPSLSEASKD